MTQPDETEPGTRTVAMRTKATVLALLLTLAVTGTVFGSEIYKWVDEDGGVHYGDRPTGEATEEHLTIRSQPTDTGAVQARVDQRQSTQAVRARAKARAEEDQPSPEELRAQTKKRAEQCSTYRARLQKYVQSRRLYRADENGERVYLDEDEMQAAREQVQGKVEEYCSS